MALNAWMTTPTSSFDVGVTRTESSWPVEIVPRRAGELEQRRRDHVLDAPGDQERRRQRDPAGMSPRGAPTAGESARRPSRGRRRREYYSVRRDLQDAPGDRLRVGAGAVATFLLIALAASS